MRKYENLDVSNPAPRCPVILLLDTSSSMYGVPITELNKALKQFLQETAADEAAGRSVELEVITFDSKVNVAMPFTTICDVQREPDDLIADGMTSMGSALRLAEQHLRERRRIYKDNGISAYRPWVVLMTDGCPTDDWFDAAQKMRHLAETGRIQYIGVEIGNGADHDTLCQILPEVPGPVKLQGLRFKQFFRWLTDSLTRVSSSTVEDQDNVQFGGISNWAKL